MLSHHRGGSPIGDQGALHICGCKTTGLRAGTLVDGPQADRGTAFLKAWQVSNFELNVQWSVECGKHPMIESLRVPRDSETPHAIFDSLCDWGSELVFSSFSLVWAVS